MKHKKVTMESFLETLKPLRDTNPSRYRAYLCRLADLIINADKKEKK